MLTRLDRTIEQLEDMVTKIQGVHEFEHRQESPAVFNARFSRCHGLLSLIASRVLGGNNGVEEAVQNCWLRASRNPPRFESEAVFSGWLLRLLIDEALVILSKDQPAVGISWTTNR